MKLLQSPLLLLAIASWSLFSCSQTEVEYGSLSVAEIHDALQSPQIAVTPLMPGWLLEPKDIHLLTHDDRLALIKIADTGVVREIPAEYYESAEQGNREDESTQLFYLYASDAQCLGCRVMPDKRILIDDLELDKSDTQKLYKLLIPYVTKMQAQLSPAQKAQAAEHAAQKAYLEIQNAKPDNEAAAPATAGAAAALAPAEPPAPAAPVQPETAASN